VVCDTRKLFKNLAHTHTGIDFDRVEEMEMRLKQDIIAEAKERTENQILVHDETEKEGELFGTFESVQFHDNSDVDLSDSSADDLLDQKDTDDTTQLRV